MTQINKIKAKVREWKAINVELKKLKDNPRAEQVIAVNREHIKDLEDILGATSNCFNASVIPETDICDDCKEHCEVTNHIYINDVYQNLDKSKPIDKKIIELFEQKDKEITRLKQLNSKTHHLGCPCESCNNDKK